MSQYNCVKEKIEIAFPKNINLTSEQLYDSAENSYPNGSPWSVESFQTDLETPLAGYGLAMKNKEIVGFIGYRYFLGEAEITNFGVHQKFKQQGIATKLMLACLTYLKEQGMKQLFLEVRSSNQVAKLVYQKCGLTEVDVRKNYYCNPIEDAIVMQYIEQIEE
ncbi:ribosomal protein S18-alanine N-acetyltransferase [Carnobacterium funditum]|uniref:ribosomal protein S18-alanine N-acetyltransferase n=1 Tax=Carnobacterium funditum TaxID=2752 RepID=UPI00055847FC|nr:ribosomal protein S18-alanine N-acetyltransferase [Carnobacterium funditum]